METFSSSVLDDLWVAHHHCYFFVADLGFYLCLANRHCADSVACSAHFDPVDDGLARLGDLGRPVVRDLCLDPDPLNDAGPLAALLVSPLIGPLA